MNAGTFYAGIRSEACISGAQILLEANNSILRTLRVAAFQICTNAVHIKVYSAERALIAKIYITVLSQNAISPKRSL